MLALMNECALQLYGEDIVKLSREFLETHKLYDAIEAGNPDPALRTSSNEDDDFVAAKKSKR